MDIRKEYDFFIDELLSRAVASFKSTQQYGLLQVEIEQMSSAFEARFTAKEQAFIMTYFDRILDVMGQEEKYVYRKGVEDGFTLLKELGVL